MGKRFANLSCFLAVCVCATVVRGLFASDIVLAIPPDGERSVQVVDPKGAKRVLVTFNVPASDVQQIWRPDLKQPYLGRKWWLSATSSSMCNMPYIAFFNMAERNRFSFGAAVLEWDCELSSKINQEKGVYTVTLVVAADESSAIRPFQVTIDRRQLVWTESLADWRNSLVYGGGSYPEAAWRPVYCSWYAVHASLSQEWVERTAAIAAKLGFGTFILDDGWSYDESKRVNPQTITQWYRDVGRWNAFSLRKFPDFKSHRERIHRLGLKYVVWVAPYFIGVRTDAYGKWRGKLADQTPFEGNVLANVSDKEMMESVTKQLVDLLRESDLDGLKIDFLDYIKPSVDKPCSGYGLAYVRDLMARLKRVKPDGLFEFRQSYATPLTVPLGTQFRAGDVPFEWLCNIMRIAQMRLAVGDRVPVHADPICWAGCETPENISRHFMAAMAGVPMLSMDLVSMSPEQQREIARWMQFYSRKVEPFQRNGKWNVAYRNGGLSYMTSMLEDRAIVFVVDPGACSAALDSTLAGKKIIVLNLSYEPVRVRGLEIPAAQVREVADMPGA